ncbi:hypothetical protein AB0G15_16735 [Streptosporangium sp. NPDC023825]|uniref:hypothetical protein n=1 Tax=Streptosporangium sp. NPDC023825 TaxID=3154909 RepID=UPI003439D0D6
MPPAQSLTRRTVRLRDCPALPAPRRGVPGPRLIVAGIGVSTILRSPNQGRAIKVDPRAARVAALWGRGSLNNPRRRRVPPVACAAGALHRPQAGQARA